MDREETKRRLRACLTLYLERYKGVSPDEYFDCLNPAHRGSGRTMRFNPKDNTVHCYGCGCTYDIFSLTGLDYNLPHFRDQLDKVAGLFRDELSAGRAEAPAGAAGPAETAGAPADYTAYFRACAGRIGETDFFAEAGITPETAVRFNLGYDPEFPAGGDGPIPAVIVPNGPCGFWAVGAEADFEDGGRVFYRGREAMLDCGGAGENVFIADSVLDAVCMAQCGVPALAVTGEGQLGDLAYFLSRQTGKRSYYLTGDPSGPLAAGIIREIRARGETCRAVDLAYPARSVSDLIRSSPEKFRERAAGVGRLLAAAPKKLLAKKSYDTVTDEAAFAGLCGARGVYGVVCDVFTKRRLLEKWVIDAPDGAGLIYHTGMAEWNVLSAELEAVTSGARRSYYSLLPTIGMSENTGDFRKDAENMLNLFASRKIKRQDGGALVVNLQNSPAAYVAGLANLLMAELRGCGHTIIFFCAAENREAVAEFCWQMFTVRPDGGAGDADEPECDVTDFRVTARGVAAPDAVFYVSLE